MPESILSNPEYSSQSEPFKRQMEGINPAIYLKGPLKKMRMFSMLETGICIAAALFLTDSDLSAANENRANSRSTERRDSGEWAFEGIAQARLHRVSRSADTDDIEDEAFLPIDAAHGIGHFIDAVSAFSSTPVLQTIRSLVQAADPLSWNIASPTGS